MELTLLCLAGAFCYGVLVGLLIPKTKESEQRFFEQLREFFMLPTEGLRRLLALVRIHI